MSSDLHGELSGITGDDLRGVTIVFVNNFAGPGLGGGEIYLLNLARGCIDTGMEVHVVSEPEGRLIDEARALGAAVAPYRLNSLDPYVTARRLAKYLRRHGAAIVHSGGVRADFIANRAARRSGTLAVNTVHVEVGASIADRGSRAGARFRAALQRSAWRRTDAIVAVSHAVARSVQGLGIPPQRITVAHGGIDAKRVRDAGAKTPDLGSTLPPGRPLVGCVARLEPVKGVSDFVRAAAVLATQRPEMAFVVVGDGSQIDSLRTLAAGLGLGTRIAFTGSVVPSAGIMARCDIVAVPSLSEGLGMVALEAMALGVPVVATRVGGLPEVVSDGVTGLLVPARDPAAMTAAMGELLGDAARRFAMGEAGLNRVLTEFSLDLMLQRHRSIYRTLLATARARQG